MPFKEIAERTFASIVAFLILAGIALALWAPLCWVAGWIPTIRAALIPTIIIGLLWGTFVYAAVALPILIWAER